MNFLRSFIFIELSVLMFCNYPERQTLRTHSLNLQILRRDERGVVGGRVVVCPKLFKFCAEGRARNRFQGFESLECRTIESPEMLYDLRRPERKDKIDRLPCKLKVGDFVAESFAYRILVTPKKR